MGKEKTRTNFSLSFGSGTNDLQPFQKLKSTNYEKPLLREYCLTVYTICTTFNGATVVITFALPRCHYNYYFTVLLVLPSNE